MNTILRLRTGQLKRLLECHSTTTDEAFDGCSVPETALDEYRWLGAHGF